MYDLASWSAIGQGAVEDVRDHSGRRRLKICVTGPTGSHLIYQRTCHFARLGHDVTFVAEHEVDEPLEGVTIHRIPHVFHEFLGPLNQALLYRRAIEAIDPDVVHVHYPHGPWGWGAALSRYPLALSVMGGDVLYDEMGSGSVHDRYLTVSTFDRADFITAKSNYMIAELKRLGGFDSKAFRILWMIDRRIFRRTDATALRSAFGIADDEQVIFSPKSLQRYYNVHLLVEAMPAILRRHPRTKLLIAEQSAQPDYKIEIQARISELGIDDRVLFVGDIDNEDMPRFFSLSDVTVALPPSDGLPMAFLEALACGTVNIVSRLENTKEVVADGYNALAIDIDADAVVQAVLRVLGEDGLRERLIKGGFETIERLPSLSEEVALVERRLNAIVERPRSAPPLQLKWKILRELFAYSWERMSDTARRREESIVLTALRSLGLRTIRRPHGRRWYFLLRRMIGRPSQHDNLLPQDNIRSVVIYPFMAWLADNTIGRQNRRDLHALFRRWKGVGEENR
jgi:glycosyltransferase involved in cell wall biosynthesis